MNICFDIFGNYKPILIVLYCVMIAVMTLLQFIITAAKKQRRLIEKEETRTENIAEAVKA